MAIDPDPRKIERGTSYNAAGAVAPDLSKLASELGSAAAVRVREIVPELSSSRAVETYTRMRRGDSAVAASLRAAKVPIIGANYYVEPYSSDDENIQIADMVEYNLLNMSKPFLLTLEDVLRCYEHGYSVLEKVFEVREWVSSRKGANRRKYTMLKKLAPRPTPTIREITYDDNGGPLTVIQNAIRGDGKVEAVELDIDKLVVATVNQEGGGLEGESILRTAYPHWYYKHHLYKVDAIQKERHGIGVPEVELLPGHTDQDRQVAHELGRNLRSNERSYIVRTSNMAVGFVEVPGQLVDVLQSAHHHNDMIMLNVMAQFLLLGLGGSGGGRATSSSHLDMFIKSLKYVGNLVCGWFNLYVIPQLVVYNWDTDKFPKLKVRNIGEGRDLQQFASAYANLVNARLIVPDEPTEEYIRETFDYPKIMAPRDPSMYEASGGDFFSPKKGKADTKADDAGNEGTPPAGA